MRVLPALTALLFATAAHADPLHVYAAGSLSGTMQELIAASGLPADAAAPPTFGPAGLLRQRIEGGEHADLFVSADLAQAQHVADSQHGGPVLPYARNQLCLLTKQPGITPDTLLAHLLDPAFRLATSTPGADPGGDWALAVFDRADQVHHGNGATLAAKAQHLFGGPTTMVPTEGHTPGGAILLQDRADGVLYYCSGAPAILAEVPGSTSVALPPALAVEPVNGLVVLGDNPAAEHLAMFMLSAPGQAILAKHGFLPILPQPPAITVLGAGGPIPLTMDALHALPATQATVPGEQGGDMHFAGPLLWTVLQQGGAAGGDFHLHLRQTLVATGIDGYAATLALGEIDPALEGKPAILALTQEGKPLAHPRLILPGDHHLARDVRDVASLVVR